MMQIKSTTDYDKFVYDPEANREVNAKKVERLAESMRLYGYEKTLPIHVDHNNVVIRGQHRLAAAKMAGVPVWYVVSDWSLPPDYESATVTTWTENDYLGRFTRANEPDYVKLSKWLADNPWCKLNGFLHASGYSGTNKFEFQTGKFKFPETYKFWAVMDALRPICLVKPWSGRKEVIVAVRKLVAHSQFSQDVWVSRIEKYGYMLEPRANGRQYFELFVSIYNFNARSNRLDLGW